MSGFALGLLAGAVIGAAGALTWYVSKFLRHVSRR